jgi:hypothetical protein
VPVVTGETLADAEAMILAGGMLLGPETTGPDPSVPAGSVISSTPEGGMTAPYKSLVSLLVSTGPAGVLAFGSPTYQVDEWATSVTVYVVRSNGSAGELRVNFATADDTAFAVSDYTPTAGTLVFADGETLKSIVVDITSDVDFEGDEAFRIEISSLQGGGSLGSPFVTSVTIVDDDPPPPPGNLSFLMAADSVDEAAGTITISVQRTGGVAGAVSVDYMTFDQSAKDIDDYISDVGTVNFPDGSAAAQTFTIPIVDDLIYEGTETFQVSLSNVQGGATLMGQVDTVVSIIDNDPAPSAGTLDFGAPDYSVSETVGQAEITVLRSSGSAGAISVDIATQDVTAVAGEDYQQTISTVMFADGQVSASVMIPILDDTLHEPTEILSIGLSNPQGGAMIGSQASAILTIMDDDPAPQAGVLQFSGPTFNVLENGVQLVLAVLRTGGSAGQLTVDYQSTDETATAGSDYQSAVGTLVFGPGEISKTITLSILDDAAFDGYETFIVDLISANPAVLGMPTRARITIIDDDISPMAGTLTFSQSDFVVTESDGIVTLSLIRIGGATGRVTVDYEAKEHLTAKDGPDYVGRSDTVTFEDGVVTQSVSITIRDDIQYEPTEAFVVVLRHPTNGAVLGVNSTATVTIVDDDPPERGVLEFEKSSIKVEEGEKHVEVKVVRSNGSDGPVSVEVEDRGGSAAADSDYTAVAETLSFADGETKARFRLYIKEDAIFEGDEELTLVLSAPQGGATLGAQDTVLITIRDNEEAMHSDAQTNGNDKGGLGGTGILLLCTLAFWFRAPRGFQRLMGIRFGNYLSK